MINLTTPTGHKCTATTDGDWVVYRCPKCEGYEVRQNFKTGRIKRNDVASKSMILHSGTLEIVPNMDALTDTNGQTN